jgi:hypothetical protein
MKQLFGLFLCRAAVLASPDVVLAHSRPHTESAPYIVDPQSQFLRDRADLPNERCSVRCYDDYGGCARPSQPCLDSGFLSGTPAVLYTFNNGVDFIDCQEECQRDSACHSTAWTNGSCTLYTSDLSTMGFVHSATKNVGTVWNGLYCFTMSGLCLLHAGSFEQPLSPSGAPHPWELLLTGSAKTTVVVISNQQATLFKPTPYGQNFLR